MRKTISSALLLLFLILDVGAAVRKPRSDILGLRIGMGEEAAHRKLRRIAHQQKEEKDAEKEGEQEVWLLHDRRLDYLLLRFNHGHELWFMTVVVRQGSHVLYSELGDLKHASKATDGRNYADTWKVNRSAGQKSYVVVARGGDPNYLTSWSISRPFQVRELESVSMIFDDNRWIEIWRSCPGRA